MLPPALVPYAPIIVIVLVFLDGLFFGLAFKKGITAFVFVILAFAIADFVGLSFIPHLSVSSIVSRIVTDILRTHLGAVTLSLSFILFLVGLAIGISKG